MKRLRIGPKELPALILSVEQVEQHRESYCPRYDLCLGEAISKGWTSWSCAACPEFGKHPPPQAESARLGVEAL